jgi:hypothetical protein
MMWCDMIYYMIWYIIYDMIRYDICDMMWCEVMWYDILNDIWYDKVWYDVIWHMIYIIWCDVMWYMIYLTAMGWHPVAVVQYTFTHKQYIEQHSRHKIICRTTQFTN